MKNKQQSKIFLLNLDLLLVYYKIARWNKIVLTSFSRIFLAENFDSLLQVHLNEI